MIRAIPRALIMLCSFSGALMLAAYVMKAGLLSEDVIRLWANVITAGDGQMPIGRIVSAYPAIPFLTTLFFTLITPRGTPTPIILAPVILAVLAGSWLAAFRRAGLPLLAAMAAALLLSLHPALLRAVIAGPADMFFAAFLFLLGIAFYDLRARSSAPEVMAVAFSLLGLAFSHPMGAAIVCAAIPLLIFVVRPELQGGPVFYLVLALVFPTVFCVIALAYISWVFPGSGWSFFGAPAQELATWIVSLSRFFSRGLTRSPEANAVIAVVIALILAAPLVPVAIIWVYRRHPLVAPALVMIAMTISAIWIVIDTGLFGDPTAITAISPVFAAIIIIRVPVARERLTIVLPLLLIGWLLGALELAVIDPRSTENLRYALDGHNVDSERMAAISLGTATAAQDGILVDTFNAPAIVLGRGRARGLLSSSSEEFNLDVAFSRIDTPFIAVSDPRTDLGAQDHINKAFPRLYWVGVPGYSLIYDKMNWRLFARN